MSNLLPNPDVSVIIPTFNRLWCLPEAVESCRRQDCNIEIIVVDDGSTDGTWEWLMSQPDVVSVKQQNWGQTWAQNRGFSLAKGEYIRYLDSDDLIPDNAVDRQLEIAKKTNADIVVAGYINWNQKENIKTTHNWHFCDDFIAQQLGECDGSHCYAYLYRKALIVDVPHRPDYAFREDRLFIIEVALRDPNIHIMVEPAYVIRQHSNNRLQYQRQMTGVVQNWQHWQLYRRVLKALEISGRLTQRRKRAAINILWPLAHWVARTNLVEAVEIVDWIYVLDPKFQPPEPGALGLLYRRLGFRRTENILLIRRSLLAAVLVCFPRTTRK
jgi:glycosyltransferase involved in cell wall biosynthesis